MGVIQDSELVLYKAVAQYINSGLEKPLKNLNAKCFVELFKFEKQKSKFMTCETYEDLGDSSKDLKVKQEELISLLAIQDRLEKIVKRNEQRISFVSSKLEQMGIYNDAVDKKTLSTAMSAEKENVNEDSLNLNPKSKGGVTYKYFAGETLAFKDDELRFDLKENREILVSASVDFIHEVVETFPYCVGTIPEEFYVISSVKTKILRECILYVASKIKTQSIAESNRELGGLLENVGEISSFSQFVNELKNYFNVVAKQFLKSQAPELADEIDETLNCNETSLFLPRDRRVFGAKKPVQEKAETAESKDVQPATDEKISESNQASENGEEKTEISNDELLSLLLNDDDSSETFDNDAKSSEGEEQKESSVDDDIEQTLKELEMLLNEASGDDEDDNKEE